MNKYTDKQWKLFGKQEPYFGVLANEKYLIKNITIEDKSLFFKSGLNYLNNVIENIQIHYDKKFVIKTALDFGCGVGRMVIPLSRKAEHVIGIDVSEFMIKESIKNCKEQSINNAEFIIFKDDSSILNNKFNFLHSFIVFQHIYPKRGLKIFSKLIKNLEKKGVGVVHFTYSRDNYVKYIIHFLKNKIPLLSNVINLIKKRNFYYPQMEMFIYDLNKISIILKKNNIEEFYREHTNHGGVQGVNIYFKK